MPLARQCVKFWPVSYLVQHELSWKYSALHVSPAVKLLRTFADSELELVSVLTKGYCPLEVNGKSQPSQQVVANSVVTRDRELRKACG